MLSLLPAAVVSLYLLAHSETGKGVSCRPTRRPLGTELSISHSFAAGKFACAAKGVALDRQVINPPQMPALNPTYSQAIRSNGFVFLAGQIGVDPATGKLVSDDIAKQAQQAMENSALILRAAGSSLEKVVSATLYLTEFEQLGRVNEVYARYFPQGGPAKTSCGVSKLYGGAKVEIQFVALA
jgi:2-iminobutanoate/2-iminopropanoate deaminase